MGEGFESESSVGNSEVDEDAELDKEREGDGLEATTSSAESLGVSSWISCSNGGHCSFDCVGESCFSLISGDPIAFE